MENFRSFRLLPKYAEVKCVQLTEISRFTSSSIFSLLLLFVERQKRSTWTKKSQLHSVHFPNCFQRSSFQFANQPLFSHLRQFQLNRMRWLKALIRLRLTRRLTLMAVVFFFCRLLPAYVSREEAHQWSVVMCAAHKTETLTMILEKITFLLRWMPFDKKQTNKKKNTF